MIDSRQLVMAYKSGLSHHDTAIKFGLPHTKVLKLLERNGVLRSKSEAASLRQRLHPWTKVSTSAVIRAYRSGMSCGQVAAELGISKSRVHQIISPCGINRSKLEGYRLRGERCPVRIGLDSNGYVQLRLGKRHWYAHRLIAEFFILGRPLLPGEVVHHRNGIKTDNHPRNLAVMNRAEHAKLHKPAFMRSRSR